jgi:hypothetical protein
MNKLMPVLVLALMLIVPSQAFAITNFYFALPAPIDENTLRGANFTVEYRDGVGNYGQYLWTHNGSYPISNENTPEVDANASAVDLHWYNEFLFGVAPTLDQGTRVYMCFEPHSREWMDVDANMFCQNDAVDKNHDAEARFKMGMH